MIGVSTDEVPKLEAWKAKVSYPYNLVSDTDHAVIEAYGAWRHRNWPPGRRSMGTARSTVLIDAEGKVRLIWDQVKPQDHAREVVAALGS